jgi:hypothetical protein
MASSRQTDEDAKNVLPRTSGLRKLKDVNINKRTNAAQNFYQEGNEDMGIILGARLNPVSCGNRNQRAEGGPVGQPEITASANRQEE